MNEPKAPVTWTPSREIFCVFGITLNISNSLESRNMGRVGHPVDVLPGSADCRVNVNEGEVDSWVNEETRSHVLWRRRVRFASVVSRDKNYAMQREEKQLDSALEAIIMRVNDLKTAIAAMIFKVEHEYETLNWPNFLDNFALISGHVSISFYRWLTSEPAFRTLFFIICRVRQMLVLQLLEIFFAPITLYFQS